jgi:AcrR family transcriptional regulator
LPGETKSARTRRRILDAAAEVFSEQGYGARLSDIADRAAMKTGSLYYHFDSREDLVAEVLALGIDGSWDQVASALVRSRVRSTCSSPRCWRSAR